MNYDEASKLVGRTAQHKHVDTLRVKIRSVGEVSQANGGAPKIDITVLNQFGEPDTWDADEFISSWYII